jgi:F-type H+-transporting ATPase subunit b
MLEIRWELFIADLLTFLICAWLIWKFAWKHILGMLDSRKERITAGLKSVEDAKAGIEELKQRYLDQLAGIEELRRRKISEAMEEAKEVSGRIKEQAHNQAEELLKKAREEIAFELSRAKQELKDSVIELAMSAAEKLITEDLSSDKDKRLIEDFLKMVEKS